MKQVLLFSLTAMFNPTLLAATTVMLLLPGPRRLMLGYLLGALMTSITLGLVIAFAAKNSSFVSTSKNTINPAADFALGGILLVIALVLRSGSDRRLKERRRRHQHRTEDKKTPRWQKALGKGDPKIAFAVGAVLSLPGASYLAALAGITKLKTSTLGTVLLVLMVNVIMLALLEVPLICYTVAPDWTPDAIERAKAWVLRHARRVAMVGSAAIGCLLIVQGLVTVLN